MHAPTEDKDEMDMEAFHQKMEEALWHMSLQWYKSTTGDLNATVRTEGIY